jgi:hypothetical protein
MTATPPWGTPTSGAAEPPPESPEGRGFVLVVEQLTGSGEGAVWRVDPAPVPAGQTRQAAREAALVMAHSFRPHHPFSPKDRAVYRISPDCLLVVVTGMTKAFHFRVNVAERIG